MWLLVYFILGHAVTLLFPQTTVDMRKSVFSCREFSLAIAVHGVLEATEAKDLSEVGREVTFQSLGQEVSAANTNTDSPLLPSGDMTH
jgi:hypothetical protein